MSKIPLVDLKAQYAAHKEELDAAVSRVVSNTAFIGGAEVKAFEEEFAEFCGGGYTASCGNGTDALQLALAELIDEPGEVIIPSHTFIATAEAVTNSGNNPVLADVDPDTYCLTPTAAEAVVTDRTRAIIPVHIYGQMCDMRGLRDVADKHGLKLIEDTAQAHGAVRDGVRPGDLSELATFSFYPGKNLGAWGDGGAVFGKDEDLVGRVRRRANHGRTDKYIHDFIGVNSRLDGMQAAVLRAKLVHLADWNEKRRGVAARYTELLSGYNGITLPRVPEDTTHVYHLYVVRVAERDRVLKHLNENGIGAGVHYPVPVHQQPAYAHLGVASDDLPISKVVGETAISLPIFPEMTDDQIVRVAETLCDAVGTA